MNEIELFFLMILIAGGWCPSMAVVVVLILNLLEGIRLCS